LKQIFSGIFFLASSPTNLAIKNYLGSKGFKAEGDIAKAQVVLCKLFQRK
jgi:hypothetical protein